MNYSVSVRYDRSQPVASIRLPVIVATDLPVTGKLEGGAMVYNNISYHSGVFASLSDALNAVRVFTGNNHLFVPKWPSEQGEWPVVRRLQP